MPLFRPLAAPHRIALVAAVLVLATACSDNDEPTVPEGPSLGGLTVTTTSNKDTLVTGDTAIITFRFTNPADTALVLESGSIASTGGTPCPALLPVAAYPGSQTVFAFILSPCFGGVDTTFTGRFGLQKFTVPPGGTVERTVPFTGISRANSTATARCLAVGSQWVLPLFFIDGELLLPAGARDVNGPALLYLKAPTANPAPCSPT
jgi:hypothetical protein